MPDKKTTIEKGQLNSCFMCFPQIPLKMQLIMTSVFSKWLNIFRPLYTPAHVNWSRKYTALHPSIVQWRQRFLCICALYWMGKSPLFTRCPCSYMSIRVVLAHMYESASVGPKNSTFWCSFSAEYCLPLYVAQNGPPVRGRYQRFCCPCAESLNSIPHKSTYLQVRWLYTTHEIPDLACDLLSILFDCILELWLKSKL